MPVKLAGTTVVPKLSITQRIAALRETLKDEEGMTIEEIGQTLSLQRNNSIRESITRNGWALRIIPSGSTRFVWVLVNDNTLTKYAAKNRS